MASADDPDAVASAPDAVASDPAAASTVDIALAPSVVASDTQGTLVEACCPSWASAGHVEEMAFFAADDTLLGIISIAVAIKAFLTDISHLVRANVCEADIASCVEGEASEGNRNEGEARSILEDPVATKECCVVEVDID